MGIYTFKGQVKVADVQAAFDSLVGRINTIIDTYNQADQVTQELDLTVGGETLGAAGYTLTVGGLKQILTAFDGTVMGVRAFRIDETHVVVTDGLYIKDDVIYKIPSQVLEGKGTDVYFDTSTHEIALTSEDGTYPSTGIIIVNLALFGTYLNEHREVQLEGLTDYKITIQKRKVSLGFDGDNTAIHRFIQGCVEVWEGVWGNICMFADNNLVGRGGSNGMRSRHWRIRHCNFLFVPKGCNSPIGSTNKQGAKRTIYTMKLNKPT